MPEFCTKCLRDECQCEEIRYNRFLRGPVDPPERPKRVSITHDGGRFVSWDEPGFDPRDRDEMYVGLGEIDGGGE